jgi:membrane protein YdbS with pleckstrin-like domain
MQLRPSLKFVKLGYVFCLVLAVGIAVYLVAQKDNADVQQWGKWAFLLPAVLLFFVVIRHLQRRMVKITILGDRLRYEAGMFSSSTRTIELIKVQDIRVDRTVSQRMFGLGDLSIETAGSSSRIEIDGIDRPQEAADHILELARAQRTKPDPGLPTGAP